MQTAQQMSSDSLILLYPGLPREVAFELQNVEPREHIFYIIWRLISTFQQSAWENKACYREQQPSQEWEILPQLWLAKQPGMNHVIHLHAQTCLFPELRQQHHSAAAVSGVMTCKRQAGSISSQSKGDIF